MAIQIILKDDGQTIYDEEYETEGAAVTAAISLLSNYPRHPTGVWWYMSGSNTWIWIWNAYEFQMIMG